MNAKFLAIRIAVTLEKMFIENDCDLEYLYDKVTDPKFIQYLIESNGE